jgi:hypothetical protein
VYSIAILAVSSDDPSSTTMHSQFSNDWTETLARAVEERRAVESRYDDDDG